MHVEEEEGQELEFQIAPMVDVVFMLIIFFMLSAAVKSTEFELGMTLPGTSSETQKGTPLTPIELAIRADGTVLWNELEVGKPDDKELKDVQDRLKKSIQLFGDDQPVIIQPQPTTVHSRIVDVVNACAGANIKALSFAG
jgi:biopolymer transport protein ExbD